MIVSWIEGVFASDMCSGAKSIGGEEEAENGPSPADCWFGSFSPFTLRVMIAGDDAWWDARTMSLRLGAGTNRPTR